MRIGGYVPFSLSDFPGRVAAVVFTQGCNFRCPYCHNAQLIPLQPARNHWFSEAEVLQNMEELSDRIGGLVISGGEPTLHSDLAGFLCQVRSFGLETKLDTNGSRPQVLRLLLEEDLLSYVAMDVKAPLEKYAAVAGAQVPTDSILESINLIAHSNIEHEFRTTVDASLLSAEDLKTIRELVPAGSPFRVQKARHPTVCDYALHLGGVRDE